jgi:hypothetical protein
MGRSVLLATSLKYTTVSRSPALYRIGGSIIKPLAPSSFAFLAALIAPFVVCSAILMITGTLFLTISTVVLTKILFSSSLNVLASPKVPPSIIP